MNPSYPASSPKRSASWIRKVRHPVEALGGSSVVESDPAAPRAVASRGARGRCVRARTAIANWPGARAIHEQREARTGNEGLEDRVVPAIVVANTTRAGSTAVAPPQRARQRRAAGRQSARGQRDPAVRRGRSASALTGERCRIRVEPCFDHAARARLRRRSAGRSGRIRLSLAAYVDVLWLETCCSGPQGSEGCAV